jgi:hypothetical protein
MNTHQKIAARTLLMLLVFFGILRLCSNFILIKFGTGRAFWGEEAFSTELFKNVSIGTQNRMKFVQSAMFWLKVVPPRTKVLDCNCKRQRQPVIQP